MTRKPNVTQEAVNSACQKLQADEHNVTVNAVIQLTGGSFSTICKMVAVWKDEQAQQITHVMQIPERINSAMTKTITELWATASTLACEELEQVKQAFKEAANRTQMELTEYTKEVTRLEAELYTALNEKNDFAKRVTDAKAENNSLTSKITTLETQLNDRDNELTRIREDYSALHSELIRIAQAQVVQNENK
jgi:chorismate mutase